MLHANILYILRRFYYYFVCLRFIVPVENFSLIWRRHHYRWRAANFDLCSALMAIEQWGFFSVPHLLWHGTFVYNGHLRGPWHSHLSPSVWQGSCPSCFYDLGLSRLGFEHPTFIFAIFDSLNPRLIDYEKRNITGNLLSLPTNKSFKTYISLLDR